MKSIVSNWRPFAAFLSIVVILSAGVAATTSNPASLLMAITAAVAIVGLAVIFLLVAHEWSGALDRRTLARSERLEARLEKRIGSVKAAAAPPPQESLEVVSDSTPFVDKIRRATRQFDGIKPTVEDHPTEMPASGQPLVTVIVALHNEIGYIEGALSSIQRQTLPGFRCLIVDDASTNNAPAVAYRFADEDDRFEVVRSQTNGGAAAARNIGLAMTSTPYVAFLDSDDMMLIDSLETRVRYLHSDPDPLLGAVYGGIQQVPENASSDMALIQRGWKPRPVIDFVTSTLEAPFNSHAPMFRTEALRVVGGFREHMRQSMEDWDCWIRILRSGYYFKGVPHFVGLYRNKSRSASRADLMLNLENSHRIFDSMNEPDETCVGPRPYRRPHSEYRVEFRKAGRSLHYAAMAAVEASVSGVDSAIATIDPEVLPSLLRSDQGAHRIRAGISRGLAADPRTWRNVQELAEPLALEVERRLADASNRVVQAPGDSVVRRFDVILVAQSHPDVKWIRSVLDAGINGLVVVTEQATGDMKAGQSLNQAGISWLSLGELSLGAFSASMVAAMLPIYGAAQRLLGEAEAAGIKTTVFENAFGIEPHELANMYQEGVPFNRAVFDAVPEGPRVDSRKTDVISSVRDIAPEEQLSGIKSDDFERFRGIHKGERCFVIGNGPSLNEIDLTHLADEYTFAVNGIFHAKDRMGFDPTYYIVEDSSVMNENLEQIREYVAGHKFFPTIYRGRYGPPDDNVSFYMMNRGFYESTSANFCWPRFSADFEKRVFSGQSVTCTNLQLAYYMGFSEVIMVGMDFSYVVPADAPRTGDTITSMGDDPNHFHSGYFGKGTTYKDPRLDRVLRSFQIANAMYLADGREVVNATAGGKLDVFRRAPYDSFFD